MNKHNIGVALIAVGGALWIVDIVAGLQAQDTKTTFSSKGYPTWYPGLLADVQDALPLSLELILIVTGGVLLYV